ncbi:hypothetical protein BpHYR1_049224 [Brachionus plicatilis]|uniref:Uncharacterized protein n=1 Tax=Brachionus plicatilis TaxID=10195 RepID=A0A3M7RXH3_BRAPC|nr:hypothetical protein BpHYR1_049224 [Brachionus plicatilis]
MKPVQKLCLPNTTTRSKTNQTFLLSLGTFLLIIILKHIIESNDFKFNKKKLTGLVKFSKVASNFDSYSGSSSKLLPTWRSFII